MRQKLFYYACDRCQFGFLLNKELAYPVCSHCADEDTVMAEVVEIEIRETKDGYTETIYKYVFEDAEVELYTEDYLEDVYYPGLENKELKEVQTINAQFFYGGDRILKDEE